MSPKDTAHDKQRESNDNVNAANGQAPQEEPRSPQQGTVSDRAASPARDDSPSRSDPTGSSRMQSDTNDMWQPFNGKKKKKQKKSGHAKPLPLEATSAETKSALDIMDELARLVHDPNLDPQHKARAEKLITKETRAQRKAGVTQEPPRGGAVLEEKAVVPEQLPPGEEFKQPIESEEEEEEGEDPDWYKGNYDELAAKLAAKSKLSKTTPWDKVDAFVPGLGTHLEDIVKEGFEKYLEQLRQFQKNSLEKVSRDTHAMYDVQKYKTELKSELRNVYLQNARNDGEALVTALFQDASAEWDKACGKMNALANRCLQAEQENRSLQEQLRVLTEENNRLRLQSQNAAEAHERIDDLERYRNFSLYQQAPAIAGQVTSLWTAIGDIRSSLGMPQLSQTLDGDSGDVAEQSSNEQLTTAGGTTDHDQHSSGAQGGPPDATSEAPSPGSNSGRGGASNSGANRGRGGASNAGTNRGRGGAFNPGRGGNRSGATNPGQGRQGGGKGNQQKSQDRKS